MMFIPYTCEEMFGASAHKKSPFQRLLDTGGMVMTPQGKHHAFREGEQHHDVARRLGYEDMHDLVAKGGARLTPTYDNSVHKYGVNFEVHRHDHEMHKRLTPFVSHVLDNQGIVNVEGTSSNYTDNTFKNITQWRTHGEKLEQQGRK